MVVQNAVKNYVERLEKSGYIDKAVSEKTTGRIGNPMQAKSAYTVKDHLERVMVWRTDVIAKIGCSEKHTTPLKGDCYLIGREGYTNSAYYKFNGDKISKYSWKDDVSARTSRLQLAILPREHGDVLVNTGNNDMIVEMLTEPVSYLLEAKK